TQSPWCRLWVSARWRPRAVRLLRSGRRRISLAPAEGGPARAAGAARAGYRERSAMSPDADHLAPGGAQLRAQACGRGDAAVGDVERAVRPGEEAGRVEQLAHAEVSAVAVRGDPHHVTRRVGGRQPAGLELGGVERAVA